VWVISSLGFAVYLQSAPHHILIVKLALTPTLTLTLTLAVLQLMKKHDVVHLLGYYYF